MKTFVFPGQGSQAKGMGKGLFEDFPKLVQRADEILGYSIKEMCLENPNGDLNRTQFTQPALYVVNALSYYRKLGESGVKPDYVAGHSLGEYNALLAAECFDFEVGLKLVKKRGELMALAPEGRMAAIMNATKDQVKMILSEHALNGIDIANHNTPQQIVISGIADEVVRAQVFFQQGNLLYYPLNTSGAFHSRLMKPASEEFKRFLRGFSFLPLARPVISNTTARPYNNDEIAVNLSAQLASSVLWCDSIRYLMSLPHIEDEMIFEEVGHGEVLTKMLRHIPKPTASELYELHNEGAQLLAPADSQVPQPSALQVAEALVSEWNARYPVGTRVTCRAYDYGQLETRTSAAVLFGHRAAIYMKGYEGYFELAEIVPVQ